MKKMLLTLAIAVSTLSAFAGEVKVSEKVLDNFKAEFTTAKDVEWTVANNYYMASFSYNEQYVFAYYNNEGELIGMTRNILQSDLPLNLQKALKKSYTNYWISDLFEVSKNEGTSYYITLENADTKVMLKSYGGSWNTYKKIKKS
jgi:hypothetical protein